LETRRSMALQCGTNHNGTCQPAEGNPSFVRRAVMLGGFVILTGAAMAILAGVVLLPVYTHNMDLEHRLLCKKMKMHGDRDTIAAMDRLIEEMKENEILISRLGRSRIGLFPNNEVVVLDSSTRGEIDPTRLKIEPTAFPDPPNNLAIELGRRLESPPMRRGLLVMAAAMMVSSMLIFPSPGTSRSSRTPGKNAI